MVECVNLMRSINELAAEADIQESWGVSRVTPNVENLDILKEFVVPHDKES